jgi:mono/diheme cytochrome c family protein
LQADLDNGSTIYDNACVACHGETGQGGQGGGPALTKNLNLSEVMLVVNDGRNTMPSFNVFTDQQLLDISTFVAERLNQ